MKLLKRWFVLFVIVVFALCVSACAKSGAAMGDFDAYYPAEGGALNGATPSMPSDGVTGEEAEGGETVGDEVDKSEVGGSTGSAAGLITASAWDDNTYYDYWKSLFFLGQTPEENGRLSGYLNDDWNLNSLNRVKVTATENGAPVVGAKVICEDEEGKELFTAKTAADGVAYLFPKAESGKITVISGQNEQNAVFDAENRDVSVELQSGDAKLNAIEIMFVVDVTGSMGNELKYLTTELTDVINRIAAADNQTQIDLAFLFYRDDGDKEKFAYCDFLDVTDEQNLALHQANLKAQKASGGGDYPEAVDEALELALQKNWSNDNTTKLIFHILDAPAHTNNANKDRYSKAVVKASAMGVRICPVLASGANLLCEYITRQAAIYTGGTFIFITDDSGIGGSHHDPDIPNAVVEALNDLLVRVIKGHHTGIFDAPVPWRK